MGGLQRSSSSKNRPNRPSSSNVTAILRKQSEHEQTLVQEQHYIGKVNFKNMNIALMHKKIGNMCIFAL